MLRYHYLNTHAINSTVCVSRHPTRPWVFFILFIRIQSDERQILVELVQLTIPLSFSPSLLISQSYSSLQNVCKTHLLYQAGTSSSKKYQSNIINTANKSFTELYIMIIQHFVFCYNIHVLTFRQYDQHQRSKACLYGNV